MKAGFRIIIFVGIIFLCKCSIAQTDSVAVTLEKIRTTGNDSLRLILADEIPGLIQNIGFESYNVAKPVKYLGYKKCTNAPVELFSWTVPIGESLAYYNLFRFKDEKEYYFLKTLPGEPNAYPWLFYDLLAFENNKETYFVLLGWAQTQKTNQKAVLVARFGPGGNINFKKPLMRRGNSRSASLTFEYARDGSMTLKFDKKGKRIIFDHLAPFDKKYEGFYMFYGPDASYDALLLKKGEWWYEENVKI